MSGLKQYYSKTKRGQFTVEVAAMGLLLVILAMVAFDLYIVVMGFNILDMAARDAARAAAATNNSTNATQAAQQAALAHKTDGYFVTQPTVVSSDVNFVTNPFGTSTPTGSPYVTVTTRCQIRVPLAINYLGAQMQGNTLYYGRTYTYPILGAPFYPNTGEAAVPSVNTAPPAPTPTGSGS